MKNIFKTICVIAGCSVAMLSCKEQPGTTETTRYVMVIHGGAGTIEKQFMTPEKEKAYTDALTEALQNGYNLIKEGKPSMDAVQAAINVMENAPLFNAGKGAVFTHDGKNELDASIMDGQTLKAGAVAGVTNIKNPINAARAVMERSEHVMMVGRGAEQFAAANGCDTVPPSYFFTQERWDQLQRTIKEEEKGRAAFNDVDPRKSRIYGISEKDKKFGTVGAVALDKNGNLAAGTSTGGMTNKKYGRVGDSPIIGAGTYCNNATAGISCTGWGEYYIREVAANRMSSLIELKKLSVQEAAKQVITEIGKMGGDGGIIGLDKSGQVAMAFNTSGMYRGTVDENGNISIHIYK
ncbi:isoaspartyl peptidase/L-asparaginase family protein [Niabella sp.]|uniref:isoaspartyl peptidase/L-asparaginase family protein n=1 Tax=Niabella sp. TaxID=1962976 RepID=UPI00260CF0D0|nr:isoaspartyl peptidase/L-asparaginase [Niabella sp.]